MKYNALKKINEEDTMGTNIKPVVKKINDNIRGLRDFHESLLEGASDKERDILLQFPTVYIHNWKDQDIIDRARVTVIMFDENQILTTEQYWESQLLEQYRKLAKQQEN